MRRARRRVQFRWLLIRGAACGARQSPAPPADTLSAKNGSRSRPLRQRNTPLSRNFSDSSSSARSPQGCRSTSEDDAVRRAYHQCVRNVSACFTARQHQVPICRHFLEPSGGLEPSTPSLPWRFRGVTRVHARSRATQFALQIGLVGTHAMRREASRVSFLMCPFCVRGLVPGSTTSQPNDLGYGRGPIMG
jgi:hypothetical protein